MTNVLNDLRIVVRSLRRSPAFFGVATATLVLAIGINAGMFTVLNAIFFRPLPYESPDQLYSIRITPSERAAFEGVTVGELEPALSSVSATAAYVERAFVVADSAGSSGGAERLQGVVTDGSLFPLLGLTAALGRVFSASDAGPGAERTVILGDAFWRRRFGGRADVVGRTVWIDGVVRTVIGVMPPRISFPDFAEFWIPLDSRDAHRIGQDVEVLIRLPGEAQRLRAQTALDALVATRGRDAARASLVSIEPRGGALLAAILGSIAFVLLIACSNVANLVIARGTARRTELALRAALGATRASLARYLAAEGAVLAACATVLGLLASVWLTDAIVAAIPMDGLPLWFDARPDLRTLLYTAALGVMTVFVAGALPAMTLVRQHPGSSLNQSGGRVVGDGGAARLRTVLVAVQIALATILTAGAGLMIRAFAAVQNVDPGHPADSILHVSTARSPGIAVADVFPADALARLASLPGVAAAGAMAPVSEASRVVDTRSPDAPTSAVLEATSPGYLQALGLPLVRGRAPRDADEQGVIVISESLALFLYADLDAALGATLRLENDERNFSVIGIASDRIEAAGGGMSGVTRVRHAYLPLREGETAQLRFHVRSAAGDPIALAPAVNAELRAADPAVVIMTPVVLGERLRAGTGNLRFFATLFSGFGVAALLLAAIGIYGVVAYTVGRRTREIGVRMALGATRLRILQHVLGSVSTPVGIGLVAGAAGAIGLGLLLQGVLYGVRPADPAALSASLLGFLLTTLLAAGIPARKATRIDPLQATRID
jgi:predicted permease